MIADRAYDAHTLRSRLAAKGTDLICPHRRTIKNRVQDGRKLRRYKRRWIIERTFSWVQSYKRVWTRSDRLLAVFHGFVHIVLLMICLRRF